MTRNGILAACALLGVAGAAFAQETGNGPTGGFELEFNRIDGDSALLLDGDIDLRYRGAGTGMVEMGFDLGTDVTFDLSEGDHYAALYAAGVVNWGFGEVAIGMPRSIGDVLIDRSSIAGIRELDDISRVFFPPVSGVLAKYGDNRAFGLRYENGMGQLRYGASVLKVQDTRGTFIEAAGEYAIGQGAVEGSVEYNTDFGKANAMIGFAQSTGQLDFGIYMARQNMNMDATSFQASVDYNIRENFTVGGDFIRLDGDDQRDIYGASMEYGFDRGIYGQFGFARDSDGANYWDASVGFEF